MKQRMLLLCASILLVGISLVVGYKIGQNNGRDTSTPENGYEACVKAGNPVMLTEPPQCRDANGTHVRP